MCVGSAIEGCERFWDCGFGWVGVDVVRAGLLGLTVGVGTVGDGALVSISPSTRISTMMTLAIDSLGHDV